MFASSLENAISQLQENEEGRREMSLSAKGLNDDQCKLLCDALRGNTTLLVLDLQSNRVTAAGAKHIACMLRSNTTLTELNLEANRLGEAGGEELCEALLDNDTIRSLHLDLNQMSGKLLEQLNYRCKLNTQPVFLKHLVPRLQQNDETLTSVDLSECPDNTSLSCVLLADILKHAKYVTSLNIANVGVQDKGADVISHLLRLPTCSLRSLNISANGVGLHGARDLSDALRVNTSLVSLTLRENKIGDDAARLFVDALKVNDTVVELDLSDNAVSNGALDLLAKALQLNANPLQLKRALQRAAANDPALTSIDFSDISRMQLSAVLLSTALRANTTILVLNLSNCHVADSGAVAIASVVKANRTLTELQLANNNITSEGGVALASAFEANQAIVYLNLANNKVGDVGVARLLAALVSNDSLTALNLELNGVSSDLLEEMEERLVINLLPKALKALLPKLQANDERYDVLDFSQYDGARFHNDASTVVLSSALMMNSRVTLLSLRDNNVGDLGAEHLATVLATNSSLRTLVLADNGIGDRGCVAIAETLALNKTLSSLDLFGNNITDVGARAIVELLNHNDTLLSVRMEQNKVSAELLRAVSVGCAVNTQPASLKALVPRLRAHDATLTEINVSHFDGLKYYDDAAVIILCHSLQDNASLVTLNLANNSFETDGAKALAEFIVQSSTITDVSLANNTIGDVGSQYIAAALRDNTSLIRLDIENNGIGDRGVESLIDALAVNDTLTAINVERNDIAKQLYRLLDDAIALNTQPLKLKRLLPAIYSDQADVVYVDLSGGGGDWQEGNADTGYRRNDAGLYTDVSCRILAIALQDSTTVKGVNLSNNAITSVGLGYLADMLECNTSLEELLIDKNGIADRGMSCSSFVCPNLCNASGVRALVSAMSVNDTLWKVSLEGNDVSQEVLDELQYAVMINNQSTLLKRDMALLASNSDELTSVDYSRSAERDPAGRTIDDTAVRMLATTLLTHTHVSSVDLSQNSVSDAGAEILADVLRVNPHLTHLDLSYNNIAGAGGAALRAALRTNHTLSSLNIDANYIPDDIVEDISTSIVINAQPVTEKVPRLNGRPRPDTCNDPSEFKTIQYYSELDADILNDALKDKHLRSTLSLEN